MDPMTTIDARRAPAHDENRLQPQAASNALRARADAVAEVAAKASAAVDREARFPAEAIDAARKQRLMGIMVPRDLGGEDGTLSDVVNICYRLGRACAST